MNYVKLDYKKIQIGSTALDKKKNLTTLQDYLKVLQKMIIFEINNNVDHLMYLISKFKNSFKTY